MMLVVMALAMAAPNPQSIAAPRKAYAACLKKFEAAAIESKMAAAAYSTAVKTACPAEADAMTKALIAYDVAMGNKRAAATANAANDVADYVLTSEERFKEWTTPAPE